MECLACNHGNPAGAAFCVECGADLVPACPSCATVNPPNAKFCMKCRTKLTAEEPPTTAIVLESARSRRRSAEAATRSSASSARAGASASTSRTTRSSTATWRSPLIKTEGPRRRRPVARAARGAGDGAARRPPEHRHRVRHRRRGAGSRTSSRSTWPAATSRRRCRRTRRSPAADRTKPCASRQQVCAGLEHAHARGIVHRDLKPGNIWFDSPGVAKIGDFGLAVALDRSRLTMAGMMVGTASYMPPEQAMGGETTTASDLYALGCVLYEMVTGRPPFVGDDTVAVISQHVNTAAGRADVAQRRVSAGARDADPAAAREGREEAAGERGAGARSARIGFARLRTVATTRRCRLRTPTRRTRSIGARSSGASRR